MNDGDPTNDPVVLCVTQPLSAPEDVTLNSCYSQEQIEQLFKDWIAKFEGGGCNSSMQFLDNPTAPLSCGGSVDVSYRLLNQNGIAVEGAIVTRTFTIVEDLEGPSCPSNWDLEIDMNGVDCVVRGYDSVADLESQTGSSVSDNCTSDEDISISFYDEIVPASCAANGSSYFDERTVLRTYTFEDACDNQSVCTQEIKYNISACSQLTHYGTISIIGNTYQQIAEGCQPLIIGEETSVTGGCGLREYMWMVSTQEKSNGQPYTPTFLNFGTVWTIVPDANEPTFQPQQLTQNTYYVRCVRDISCCEFKESNIVGYRINNDIVCQTDNADDDCEKDIYLTAPADNMTSFQATEYKTNRKIEAENKIVNGAELKLNGKQGVLLKPGFEVGSSAKLEAQVTGCNDE